jgi:glutaredoxin
MASAQNAGAAAAADVMPAAVAGHAGLQEDIQSTVASHAVVVYGESWCPFSIEAARVCEALQVEGGLRITMLDKADAGGQIRAALKASTNHMTVPYVFVNGVSVMAPRMCSCREAAGKGKPRCRPPRPPPRAQKFIGGCDSLKTLQYTGELFTMVRAAAAGVEAGGPGPFSGADGSAVALDAESAPLPLFDFAPILDDRVVRLVGVLVSSHKLTRMAGFSLRSPLHARTKQLMHVLSTGLRHLRHQRHLLHQDSGAVDDGRHDGKHRVLSCVCPACPAAQLLGRPLGAFER